MSQMPIRSTTAALFLVCSCKLGGNVASKEFVAITELHTAPESGVTVKDFKVTTLGIKSEDGTINKDISLSFAIEGNALKDHAPGVKYSCAFSDLILGTDLITYGNLPNNNKLEPSIPLIKLNSYLRSTKSPEPAVCQIELRLEPRAPQKAPHRVTDQKPVGMLCYRNDGKARTITEGACPDVQRKALSATTAVTPKLVSVAWKKLLQPPTTALFPGLALVANQSPMPENLAVRIGASRKDEKLEERISFGRTHFEGVAVGEAIWSDTSFFGQKGLSGAAKQCELTVQIQDGETPTGTTKYCVTGEAFKEGGC